jgi:hypothetical protein
MVIRVRDAQNKLFTFGRFEEGHVLRLTDLVPNNQAYSLLELKKSAPSQNLAKVHRCESKAVVYRKLLLDFLAITTDELIRNFSTYQLPTTGKATWRVQPKSATEVAYIRQLKTYKFVDFAKSEGRIYELVMTYRAYGRKHRRLLRVDYRRYQRLCKLVENPNLKRSPRPIKTRELALRLSEFYPHLEPESIVATCIAFMRLLFGVVRKGHELRIASGAKVGAFNLKLYKVNFNVKKVNLRALRGSSRRRRERWVRRRRVYFQRQLGIAPLPDLFELNPR